MPSIRSAASHRLRTGRHSQAGRIYLITTVTHNRQPLFGELEPGRILVNALQQVQPSATTLAYVVMPDHLHWLMQLQPDHELSTTVRLVKALTSRRLRLQQAGPQPVWQRGFYDRALRYDADLKAMTRYVLANPVRAGLVGSVRSYSLWDCCWL